MKDEQIGKAAQVICMGKHEAKKIKQMTNRRERRKAKANPEEAPKRRRYKGYLA